VFTNQTAAAANTYESKSISTIVPPTARAISGTIGSSLSGAGGFVGIAGDSSGRGEQLAIFDQVNAGSSFKGFFWSAPYYSIPLMTAQTFYWKSFDNTTAFNRIDITGWEY
jgi:hypothetical protein